MSITILAQSDTTNVEFKKCGNCGIEFGVVSSSLPFDTSVSFKINDETGNSPIIVQAKLTEMHGIINFLQERGITISAEKMKTIKEKIDFERNNVPALIKASS